MIIYLENIFINHNWGIIRAMVVVFARRCSDVVCVEAWKVAGTINPIETRLKVYYSPPATSLPTSPEDKGNQNIRQKKTHHPLPLPFIRLPSYILPSIVYWLTSFVRSLVQEQTHSSPLHTGSKISYEVPPN
jgi:hypothetical protein